jgi:hypothetical protein
LVVTPLHSSSRSSSVSVFYVSCNLYEIARCVSILSDALILENVSLIVSQSVSN